GAPDFGGGYIRIGGPGALLVQAGRGIDLGVSQGITAIGLALNPTLAGQGITPTSATVNVVTGYSGDLSIAEIDKLLTLLKEIGTAQNAKEADERAQAILGPDYRSRADARYYERANADGSPGAVPGETKADVADAAVSPFLKPQSLNAAGVGNLPMFQSTTTSENGGGINILAPAGLNGSTTGGNINAGLPVQSDRDIGIISTGGPIRLYTWNNQNVNQSKVI